MPPKRQKTEIRIRFDVQVLRALAGDTVFTRGRSYRDNGKVEIVAIGADRVVARVAGTEVYRATMQGSAKRFAGERSCPAFRDFGFCKHLVATALAANDLSPDAADQITSRRARLSNYLRGQGMEALVERLMALADRDPALLADLELACAAAGDDDNAILARFRGAIADAVSVGDYVEYAEAGGWTAGITAVLDRIDGLVTGGKAALALPLLDDFFDEMEEALGAVDDSDGHGGDLIARASEIHLRACLAAKPDPVALAGALYAREVDSDWDFFHGASSTYADVLGKEGLAEYRRLADEAWKKIKPLDARRRGDGDDDRYGLRFRLSSILDSFAERDGDLDARIAVRRKDLSTAYDYLEIARLCREQGRDAEALKWTEEGLWQFEDAPDGRLVLFAGNIYMRIGRRSDAEKVLWREFERSPSLDFYKPMKVALEKAAEVKDRAVRVLTERLGKPSREALRSALPAEVLVQILSYEECFDEAWQVLERHKVGNHVRMRLAEATQNSHPAHAWKAFAGHVETVVSCGGRDNYKEACRYIERIGRLRAVLGEQAAHAAWANELVLRHKAKRTFVELLRR
jgi:uncharacterized Zn finger protein